MKYCKKCDMVFQNKKMRFCPYCGTQLKDPPALQKTFTDKEKIEIFDKIHEIVLRHIQDYDPDESMDAVYGFVEEVLDLMYPNLYEDVLNKIVDEP